MAFPELSGDLSGATGRAPDPEDPDYPDDPECPPAVPAIRRRRFLVAALLFMAGSFIAPLTIQLLKPLPTDYDATFRTAETSALVAGDTVTPANADRPECATPDLAPHSCFVDEVAAVSTQHTTTAATDTRTEITAETTRELLLDGEPTARLDDEVRLARSSGYPVSDPVSRLVIDAPGLPGELAPEPFIRTGLQYFFPFTLERRSYDYFDTTAQLTVPLDYVGEGEHNGHEAYELHHTVTAVPLAEAVARAYLHPTELTARPSPSGGALFGLLSDEQRAMTRAGHTSGRPAVSSPMRSWRVSASPAVRSSRSAPSTPSNAPCGWSRAPARSSMSQRTSTSSWPPTSDRPRSWRSTPPPTGSSSPLRAAGTGTRPPSSVPPRTRSCRGCGSCRSSRC
ncbi:porin PorA family protein [Corynebacterium suedekumii]|nr:porin PorA family protein [Corynebacterium suedekumii]